MKFPPIKTHSSHSAFELYASVYGDEREKAAKHFKKTFCFKDVHVHFVGSWYVIIICHSHLSNINIQRKGYGVIDRYLQREDLTLDGLVSPCLHVPSCPRPR